jgi:phospholipid transport system substrate-binding protein
MMKRPMMVLTALLVLMTTSSLQANPYAYGYPQYQGQGARTMPGQYGAQGMQPKPMQAVAPDEIVRQGIDRLKGFLSRGNSPSEQELLHFLNREIAPYFDFAYMAQQVAGSNAQGMNQTQKGQFSSQLKRLFFGALARNLGAYSNPAPRIDIYPARMNPGSREVKVNALVMSYRGRAMRLQFRFYLSANGWKIFDVTANGSSAVVHYRNYFANMARQGGSRPF